MRSLSSIAFLGLISVSLALPIGASTMLSANVGKAEELMRNHPIELPESIGVWRRSHSERDTAQPNVVRVEYCNNSQRRLFVVVQRGSALSSMHDLHDCLVATGGAPTCLSTMQLQPDWLASLVRTAITAPCCPSTSGGTAHAGAVDDLHRYLSLMWFQNSTASAPDRWSWRAALLKNVNHFLPVYDQVEVTVHESSQLARDVSQLTEVAKSVHSSLTLERQLDRTWKLQPWPGI